MIDVKVADASAVAAVLFAEPDAEAVAVRFGDATLTAPTLLPIELANICLMKIRRNPTQRGALLEALSLFEQLRIELVDVDIEATLALAEAAKLTVYDGCYLWLARQLTVDLVTLDRALAKAAASP